REARLSAMMSIDRAPLRAEPGAFRAESLKEWSCLALATLLLSGTAGCTQNSEAHPQTVTVKGKVTYLGRPLMRGPINFLPDDGRPAIGEIQADGSYSLSTFNSGDGAVLGHHRVVVTSTDGDPTIMPGSPGYRPPKELVPKKYMAADSSGLEANVS